MENIIEEIQVRCKKFNLIKPYVLSFDTIKYLDSIQVLIKLSNGETKRTETVPLPGYSDETKQSILKYLTDVVPLLTKKNISEARLFVAKDIEKHPFACSPILTGIDLFNYDSEPLVNDRINFVIPFTSSKLEEIERFIKKLPEDKPVTIKIKLTGILSEDLACLTFLEKLNLQKVFIRFDANQAFNYSDSVVYYQNLSSVSYLANVHYVEQPLPFGAWEEHAELVKRFPFVNTMLDESIVTNSDLYRAISIHIPFIKFKLFKQGGIKELTEQINTAFEHHIKIVLGNGVATSLSNDIENSIYLKYKDKIFGDSEANGFMKLLHEETPENT